MADKTRSAETASAWSRFSGIWSRWRNSILPKPAASAPKSTIRWTASSWRSAPWTPIHHAFSQGYADRFSRLEHQGQAADRHAADPRNARHAGARQGRSAGGRHGEALEAERREADDNAVYDIIDQKFAYASLQQASKIIIVTILIKRIVTWLFHLRVIWCWMLSKLPTRWRFRQPRRN